MSCHLSFYHLGTLLDFFSSQLNWESEQLVDYTHLFKPHTLTCINQGKRVSSRLPPKKKLPNLLAYKEYADQTLYILI